MTKRQDEVLIGPKVGPTQRACLRLTEGHFSTGTLEENPEHWGEGEFVELQKQEGSAWHDVKEAIPITGRGPAQVSSGAYRKGWDAIFGKRAVGKA